MAASTRIRGATLAALAATALVATAATATPPGAELYEFCAQCHGTQGEGNQLFMAPAIAGLQEWYVANQVRNFKAGRRGVHPQDIAGLRMHPMALALEEDEIDAVSVYVASLPPVNPDPVLEGGDPERGQQLYAPCLACHGPDGNGNQALNSPNIQNASDWYLLSSLQRYKNGLRSYDPANANAQVMRGMVGTLADEQAMRDVVAYIMTLREKP
jgi:cytochrome c553